MVNVTAWGSHLREACGDPAFLFLVFLGKNGRRSWQTTTTLGHLRCYQTCPIPVFLGTRDGHELLLVYRASVSCHNPCFFTAQQALISKQQCCMELAHSVVVFCLDSARSMVRLWIHVNSSLFIESSSRWSRILKSIFYLPSCSSDFTRLRLQHSRSALRNFSKVSNGEPACPASTVVQPVFSQACSQRRVKQSWTMASLPLVLLRAWCTRRYAPTPSC